MPVSSTEKTVVCLRFFCFWNIGITSYCIHNYNSRIISSTHYIVIIKIKIIQKQKELQQKHAFFATPLPYCSFLMISHGIQKLYFFLLYCKIWLTRDKSPRYRLFPYCTAEYWNDIFLALCHVYALDKATLSYRKPIKIMSLTSWIT